MAKNKHRFDPNAAFTAVSQEMMYDVESSQNQQIVENVDLSHVEYDPMLDGGNMPYVPSGQSQSYQQSHQPQPIQNGFVDMNNIENFSIPQGQGQVQPQLYESSMQEPGMDYGQASKNIGAMSNVMDSFNNVDQSTATHNDNESYAIDVALKNIHDAIKVLKDVEYWIPSNHTQHAPTLKKVAQPIVNALTVYVDKIGKMK